MSPGSCFGAFEYFNTFFLSDYFAKKGKRDQDFHLRTIKEKVDEIKKEQKDPNKYIDKYLEKRNDENNYYIIFR